MEAGGPQYALNLYALAESIKAMLVLEVGAGWGWSARAFAHSLSKRGGILVSIDPHPERIKPENRGRIDAMEMSWDIRKARSEDTPFNEPIDLLYIDGNPANAADDFRRYYENVRAGGIVVIDGYGGQSQPTEFVESQDFDFLLLPYNDTYAHAVRRKPVPHDFAGRYEAVCEGCYTQFRADYWSAMDAAIDKHVETAQHTVTAIAGPRRLRYRKGPR